MATDLESLVGKLTWVVEVMIAGKAHIWPLRQALPHGWYHHRRLHATIRLGVAAHAALVWWEQYMAQALNHPFWVPFWTHSAPLHCRTFSPSFSRSAVATPSSNSRLVVGHSAVVIASRA